ncbi:MAG: hypothetical protein JW731_04155 [Bacteroidales bacterium]|nr:hypothetical protein [Bacteroidales bacterium]
MKKKDQEKNEYTSLNDWHQEIKYLIWPFIIMMAIVIGVLIFIILNT